MDKITYNYLYGIRYMVFLCFAVKDRAKIVENFYQYISNFGLNVWYDRKNTNIGDNRLSANIENGVKNKNIKYAVVFYSKNFVNGRICLEEFRILKERYYNNELSIFPVFLDGEEENIDPIFSLCKELVYKSINKPLDYYYLSLFILAKITSDEISSHKIKTLSDYLIICKNKTTIVYKLLVEYENINKRNYGMRIGMLFSIFTLLSEKMQLSYFHIRTMHFIFYQNCIEELKEENKELIVMENIVLHTLFLFETS